MLGDLQRRFICTFRSRHLFDYEWEVRYSDDISEITFGFHVERMPRRFELLLAAEGQVLVEDLKLKTGDEVTSVPFHAGYQRKAKGLEIEVYPLNPAYADKAILSLSGTNDETRFQAMVRAASDDPRDLNLLQAGYASAEAGEVDKAVRWLGEYESYSRSNPLVNLLLSRMYRKKGARAKAEEYALRTIVSGNFVGGAEIYREIQEEEARLRPQPVREMQKESLDWIAPASCGLVVLERSQRFLFGLDGCHLRTCRELLEVRRPAAARMLRSRGFHFSAGNESILYTGLRVLHGDDEIEQVPTENFTVSDSVSNDIFVTVEDEKSGQWILPDLEAGDVVELSYHLICREPKINETPDGFVLTRLHDDYHPTVRARAEFVAPSDMPIRFATRNLSQGPEERTLEEDGKIEYLFSGTRFTPSKYTGFAFEQNYLNPLITCSAEGISWEDVAASSMKANFGERPADELPEAIRAALEGGGDRWSALERAFYWIRDKLKYASLMTGTMRVGKEARAQKILEAGTADCKDKSFLLSLVCRHLDIPYEFVAISTKTGITIEELPAQQFDHVFVRAQGDEGWIYLDAANNMSPFGSAPAWCQGLEAMVLDEKGSIITIDVDEPGRNRLSMSETFDRLADGWLEGRFDFKAEGHSGRAANERWKAISLSLDDPEQAAQEGLRAYMPFSIVSGHDRISDTSSSSLFHVSGRHRRASLIPLGTQGLIGRLTWEVPTLPVSYWRILRLDRLFVVEFPIRVDLDVKLEGEVFRAVQNVSAAGSLENGFVSIVEDIQSDERSISVHRAIEFKQKFVRSAEVSSVPAALEEIEKALQFVVSLKAG